MIGSLTGDNCTTLLLYLTALHTHYLLTIISITMPDLRRVAVHNVEALLALVAEGVKRRRTAATRRNNTSSRSHALLEIASPHATLHLADLAGRYIHNFSNVCSCSIFLNSVSLLSPSHHNHHLPNFIFSSHLGAQVLLLCQCFHFLLPSDF